jgi:putative ABC transport system substrate-binding protein
MSHELSRRVFLAAGAAALFAAPLAVQAQPTTRVYTVGILSIGSPVPSPERDVWIPFVEAMRELNYVEGRNLVVKRVSAEGRAERLSGLARDLARANVDVIVAASSRETRAAKDATSAIPIVMAFATDPVGQGLVSSLARPGWNVTGQTNLVPGLRQKWVELLREAVPSASRFAVIASPGTLGPDTVRELEGAARRFGLSLSHLRVHGSDDFEAALIRARKEGAAGVVASPDNITFLHRRMLVGLIQKHRLPAIYWAREYVEDGGLMSYSANLADLRRRVAIYVDRIFKGAHPANLPVAQPTTFELLINLKAARALGLTLPPSLLLRADETIE